MEFKRALEVQLEKWKKSDDRKPLIIRGARQVGKTTLIKDFAKTISMLSFLIWRNQMIAVTLMISPMFKRSLKLYR